MTKYKCPDCATDLVQMLEREPWDTAWDDNKMQFQNPSKHYGFYCKLCTQMFKEDFHLIPDGVQSSNQTVKSDE